ncbi:hypothetical protein P7D22_15760 [Lichenihabitans sp. Uapishka_5]|nr:hypothetical protein [Lichenihabitans sp. Uapishka_5]MDX7952626.1 hypothetical protein [Lichenihabitans sp. Uapishka_5]
MKIIVGLVLTGKLLLLLLFVYILFGNGLPRGGTAVRSTTQAATLLQR